MDYRKTAFTIGMILLLILQSIIAYADAQPANKYENVAVVMVIDTSGSMEKTDPKRLRGTAADIFIDLLSPEDYLGIITFNTSVNVAEPIARIGNNEKKRKLKEGLTPQLKASGDTNYQLALSEAKQQLDGLDLPGIRKVIVFLTDGKPDPDPLKKNDATFMEGYLNSLWKTVSQLSSDGYPVYSVGFSDDINPEILQRISLETRGEYQDINDAAELASSFFKILSNLKNRNIYFNEDYNIIKNNKIDLEFDKGVSQITLVFTHSEDSSVKFTLIPPKEIRDKVNSSSMNETSKYTIITLNQINGEASGKWSVNLKGNGIVKAFGAKDLFIKSWIKKPAANSILPVGIPIEIETEVTGAGEKKLYVEAFIKKNGIREAFPVVLEENEHGVYRGSYGKADQTGEYDIEINIFDDKKLISSSSLKIRVKAVPELKTDFCNGKNEYLLGKSVNVTSWLEMNGNHLKPSSDLKIENCQIRFTNEDETKEVLALYDSGKADHGDILAKDGIYSGKVKFHQPGLTEAVLSAKGVYKGETFLLEKHLDNYQVFPSGMICINHGTDSLYGKRGSIINIPFTVKSTSAFAEILNLSVNQTYGTLLKNQITIEPGESTEIEVPFRLNDDLQSGLKSIPVVFSVQEPLTKLQFDQAEVEIEVVTSIGWMLRMAADIIILLAPLLIFLILIVLCGLLLYRVLVYPKTIVQGELSFFENSDSEKVKKELKLKSLKKSTVSISLNGDDRHHNYNERLPYKILLIVQYEKGKWKFIEGYKALGKNKKSAKLILKATEPGVFQYNGNIYTQKEINHGDTFQTGGYTFQYLENGKRKEVFVERDLLEGKI